MGEQFFDGSCLPIHKANCTAGQDLIDPCSCTTYFECDVQYRVINRTCSLGTAYNHKTESCTNKEDVYYNDICNPEQPWNRCRMQGANLAEIESRCTGSTVLTSTLTTTSSSTTTQKETTDTSGDIGLIVGCIFGVLFVIVVLILIVVLWRKRQKSLEKKKLEARPSLQNPQYFVESFEKIEDDPYNFIDEEMNHPVYNNNTDSTKGPSLPNRPATSGTMMINGGTLNIDADITKHNTNTLSSNGEGEYVEPSVTDTIRSTDSSVLDNTLVLRNGNTEINLNDDEVPKYIECKNLENHEVKDGTINREGGAGNTPYDNSWMGHM